MMRSLTRRIGLLLWIGLVPGTAMLFAPNGEAVAQSATGQRPSETNSVIPPRPLPGDVMRYWPAYPEEALAAGQEGVVVVGLRISATGQPEDIRVERSSGVVSLDVAAVSAVNLWRFEPGKRNGVAEAVTVSLPIRFSLPSADRQPDQR